MFLDDTSVSYVMRNENSLVTGSQGNGYSRQLFPGKRITRALSFQHHPGDCERRARIRQVCSIRFASFEHDVACGLFKRFIQRHMSVRERFPAGATTQRRVSCGIQQKRVECNTFA